MDPETQAAIEAAKEAQQAAAKANGGVFCGASWIRLGEKNIKKDHTYTYKHIYIYVHVYVYIHKNAG